MDPNILVLIFEGFRVLQNDSVKMYLLSLSYFTHLGLSRTGCFQYCT